MFMDKLLHTNLEFCRPGDWKTRWYKLEYKSVFSQAGILSNRLNIFLIFEKVIDKVFTSHLSV